MSRGITARLFKGDRTVWCVFFIFCVLSLIEVFSASSRQTYDSGNYWGPITKHSIFILAGVFVVWFMHNMKSNWIKGMTKIIYFLGLGMLIYAALGGGAVRNESNRWIKIMGFEFQHFEVVKLGIVMIISSVLARAQCDEGTRFSWNSALSFLGIAPRAVDKKGDYTMLTILMLVAIPSAFIVTENLSTVLILVLVTLAMMTIGGVNWKQMLLLVVTGAAGIVLGIAVLLQVPEEFKDAGPIGNKVITWKHRFEDVFKADGDTDPKKVKIAGEEQRIYSKIAIVEGGFFGRGPGNSVRRDYIPHANSDFIFAVILEELGIVGGAVVVILYLILLYRCGKIANECEDPYASFLAIGIGILITIQAFMHMYITVGNFVTGQPLPLISQGGTSFLVNCMYIGILLSISRYVNRLHREKEIKAKREAEALS